MFDLLSECLNVIKDWLLSPIGLIMIGFSLSALLFGLIIRFLK